VRKMRKYRFFNGLRLRKRTSRYILSILVVCSAGMACADEAVSDAADAVVRIRPNDAERLKELIRLREQAVRDAEKVRRLELELDASKQTVGRLRPS